MDQAKELQTLWKAMQEMRVALDVEQLTSRERHHQLESRHEQLEERVARLDAEIAGIREDTNMQVDRELNQLWQSMSHELERMLTSNQIQHIRTMGFRLLQESRTRLSMGV
eukprot:gene6303-2934_t